MRRMIEILFCVQCGGGQRQDVSEHEVVVVVRCSVDGVRECDGGVQVGQDDLVVGHHCDESCRCVDVILEVCVIGMIGWWSEPIGRTRQQEG